MQLPEYEYSESPVAGARPTTVPMLPAHFGQALARSLVIGGRLLAASAEVDTRLEESRLAVREAKFNMEMDARAAQARENPNLDLSPEQNQQAYARQEAEATQTFAQSIRNERLRNQFLARSIHRIGFHAIQVRHDASRAWNDDILAGSDELYHANLSRFQFARSDEERTAIEAEQFQNIDDLVRNRVVSAVRGEMRKKTWIRQAQSGSAKESMRRDPRRVSEDLEDPEKYPGLLAGDRDALIREARAIEHQYYQEDRERQREREQSIKHAQEQRANDVSALIVQGKYGEASAALQDPEGARTFGAHISELKRFLDQQSKEKPGDDDADALERLTIKYAQGTLRATDVIREAPLLSQKTQERFIGHARVLHSTWSEEAKERRQRYNDALASLRDEMDSAAGQLTKSRAEKVRRLRGMMLDEFRVRARDSKVPEDPARVKDELILRARKALGTEGKVAAETLIRSLPPDLQALAVVDLERAKRSLVEAFDQKKISAPLYHRYGTVLRQISEAQEVERRNALRETQEPVTGPRRPERAPR